MFHVDIESKIRLTAGIDAEGSLRAGVIFPQVVLHIDLRLGLGTDQKRLVADPQVHAYGVPPFHLYVPVVRLNGDTFSHHQKIDQ